MHTNKGKIIFVLALLILFLGCSQAYGQGSIPSGWTDQDIGAVGVAGSASYANGTFTVTGAGPGMWGTSDEFNFAYLPLSGDGTIVARVVTCQAPASYAAAGVMIRNTLDAGSINVKIADWPSYGYIWFDLRTSEGASTSEPGSNSETLPYWLMLVRSGSTFTGYLSPDGFNWVQSSSQTVSMNQDVYIGLVVTSGTSGTSATATFDNVSVSTTANAAPTITGVSATTGSVGGQVVISGTGFGSTQGSSAVLLNGTPATINSWAATSITMTIPSGATSGYLSVAVAPSMIDSNPVDFTVTSSPLPTGWLDQDVGVVGIAGSATYTNGVFTVAGAGSIWDHSADAFHFAYQDLSGDGTIVARMVGVNDSCSETGIMIRETLNADAASVMVLDCNGTIYIDSRTATGGTSTAVNEQSGNLPYWLMLVRSGSTFTGYASADGVNWVPSGSSQTISMAQNVYVGLAVASGSTNSKDTATFDNVSVSTTANPAPTITGVSATTGSVGSQVVISGTGFGSSQGSSVVLLNDVPVTINSWSSTSITITIPSGATSGYLVVSVAPSMIDSNPVDFTVTADPLPTGWLDQDIGVVGVAGSASYTNGVFTVAGAGEIWISNADAFHFAYQELSGDGTIVARVASASNTSAEAGVMIRSSLEANATSMVVMNSGSGTIYADYRTTIGGTSSYVNELSASMPYWVKLVRTGNSFTGYASPDGVSWTLVAGPLPIDMAQIVYIGLAVTSETTNAAYTVAFDNVSVSTPTSSSPAITGVSATTGSVGSQVVISGTGFGSSEGSSVVLLNDVPVTINSWSSTTITITIPSGATSGYLVVAVAPSMISSNGVYFTVSAQPLPSGWLDQDVGVVGKTGSSSYASGIFTVQGAGAGVYNQADSFHFVYQPLASDGTIVARVTSISNYAQAGVMVRETLDAGSAETFCYLIGYGQSGTAYMNYRPFANGAVSQSGSQNEAIPYWVEVSRSANSFSTYISSDGSSWVQIGSTQTFSTAQMVYVGLGVSSGSTNTLATATFDNASVGSGSSLPNPIATSLTPTSGAPGTTVTISGSGFGSTQGSSSVFFNGASATVSSWSDSQIVVVAPDNVTTGPVSITVGNITSQGPTFSVVFSVQLTDSLGNHTSFSSSVSGGQWEFTSAQGSGCSTCTTRGTIQNQYDAFGNLAWTTDALGNSTVYAYNSSGNLTTQYAPIGATSGATTTYTYNSFGEVLTMTDPLGNVTTNSYDSHGNLLSVTPPRPSSNTAASVTQFAYNSLGELTQVTDPLGHVTTMTYTSAGLMASITDAQSNVTSYSYDSRGNRTSVTDAMSNQTSFAYDSGSRLTQITYPDSTTASFTYDYRGRRISATDQNGKTTTYAYDDADRLSSVTDAASNVTSYTYDTENNLLSITDANGHTTNFSYDAYGRLTETISASNYFETYAYDADNNLTSKTDRKGQTIQYVYDALSRLTQKSYPDSTSAEYTYDLVGKVLQVNDPTGTYAFAYDNMGRLIGTTTTYSFLSNTPFTTSYSYDANSDRTGFTAPDGSTNSYSYDTLNRMSNLTSSWAGSFGVSYDVLSRRTQLTRPNGVATYYSYDSLSQLLSVLHKTGGSTIDGASYTLDSAGNRTAKTDYLAGVTSNYSYDGIYELTQVLQGGTTKESYTYDPVGNRLHSLGVSSYTNNVSNELTATSNGSYTYDYNGNLTSKTISSGTTSYAWDFENRVTSVTLPNSGGTVSFKYDPFGRRIYKSSSSGTSIYAYDGSDIVEETNSSGSVVARYSRTENTDEPLAMLRSSTTSYYEQDGLSSVTSLTTAAGSLTQTYTFDSFGKLTASSGSLINPFQYTAREFDSETGLYFNRARYYDPQTGRFVSGDPLEFAGSGPSFYVYANNHSVDWVDPFGLAVTCPSFLMRWCQPPPPPIPVPPQPPWYSPATMHHPAPPSPQLGKLLDCIAHNYGQPIFYNSTSEFDPTVGHLPNTPHGRGEAADIEYPANPADADKILCAAAGCGAGFGKDEGKHPSAKSSGPHVHVQLGRGTRGGRGDLPPSNCCSK